MQNPEKTKQALANPDLQDKKALKKSNRRDLRNQQANSRNQKKRDLQDTMIRRQKAVEQEILPSLTSGDVKAFDEYVKVNEIDLHNYASDFKIKVGSGVKCFKNKSLFFTCAIVGHVDILKHLMALNVKPKGTELQEAIVSIIHYHFPIEMLQALLEYRPLSPAELNSMQIIKKEGEAGGEMRQLLVTVEPLFAAIAEDYFEAFVQLHQHGASLTYVNSDGITPLQAALDYGRSAFVQYLTTTGGLALQGVQFKDGTVPLKLAIEVGDVPTLKRLLEGGADPNAPFVAHTIQGETLETYPLFHALSIPNPNKAIVSELILAGASLSLRNVIGATPLQYLATLKWKDAPAVAELMLKRGAKLEDTFVQILKRKVIYAGITQDLGITSLQPITQAQTASLINSQGNRLQNNPDKQLTAPISEISDIKTPETSSLEGEQSEIASSQSPSLQNLPVMDLDSLGWQGLSTDKTGPVRLDNIPESQNLKREWTAIEVAASSGNLPVLKCFGSWIKTNHKGDVNLKRHFDQALWIAVMEGKGESQAHIVSYLLDEGADPNVIVKETSILVVALQKGPTSVLNALLVRGADPNLGQTINTLPLLYAIGLSRISDEERLDIILKKTNLYSQLGGKIRPLEMAVAFSNLFMVQKLLTALRQGREANTPHYQAHKTVYLQTLNQTAALASHYHYSRIFSSIATELQAALSESDSYKIEPVSVQQLALIPAIHNSIFERASILPLNEFLTRTGISEESLYRLRGEPLTQKELEIQFSDLILKILSERRKTMLKGLDNQTKVCALHVFSLLLVKLNVKFPINSPDHALLKVDDLPKQYQHFSPFDLSCDSIPSIFEAIYTLCADPKKKSSLNDDVLLLILIENSNEFIRHKKLEEIEEINEATASMPKALEKLVSVFEKSKKMFLERAEDLEPRYKELSKMAKRSQDKKAFEPLEKTWTSLSTLKDTVLKLMDEAEAVYSCFKETAANMLEDAQECQKYCQTILQDLKEGNIDEGQCLTLLNHSLEAIANIEECLRIHYDTYKEMTTRMSTHTQTQVGLLRSFETQEEHLKVRKPEDKQKTEKVKQTLQGKQKFKEKKADSQKQKEQELKVEKEKHQSLAAEKKQQWKNAKKEEALKKAPVKESSSNTSISQKMEATESSNSKVHRSSSHILRERRWMRSQNLLSELLSLEETTLKIEQEKELLSHLRELQFSFDNQSPGELLAQRYALLYLTTTLARLLNQQLPVCELRNMTRHFGNAIYHCEILQIGWHLNSTLTDNTDIEEMAYKLLEWLQNFSQKSLPGPEVCKMSRASLLTSLGPLFGTIVEVGEGLKEDLSPDKRICMRRIEQLKNDMEVLQKIQKQELVPAVALASQFIVAMFDVYLKRLDEILETLPQGQEETELGTFCRQHRTIRELAPSLRHGDKLQHHLLLPQFSRHQALSSLSPSRDSVKTGLGEYLSRMNELLFGSAPVTISRSEIVQNSATSSASSSTSRERGYEGYEPNGLTYRYNRSSSVSGSDLLSKVTSNGPCTSKVAPRT